MRGREEFNVQVSVLVSLYESGTNLAISEWEQSPMPGQGYTPINVCNVAEPLTATKLSHKFQDKIRDENC